MLQAQTATNRRADPHSSELNASQENTNSQEQEKERVEQHASTSHGPLIAGLAAAVGVLVLLAATLWKRQRSPSEDEDLSELFDTPKTDARPSIEAWSPPAKQGDLSSFELDV